MPSSMNNKQVFGITFRKRWLQTVSSNFVTLHLLVEIRLIQSRNQFSIKDLFIMGRIISNIFKEMSGNAVNLYYHNLRKFVFIKSSANYELFSNTEQIIISIFYISRADTFSRAETNIFKTLFFIIYCLYSSAFI